MGLFSFFKNVFSRGGRTSVRVVGWVGKKGLAVGDRVLESGSRVVVKGSKMTIKHVGRRSVEFVKDTGEVVSISVKKLPGLIEK
ncbi:hypothetical protein COT72_04290 [archaeon CG10_big_fil_rev_8_21_14_0_10_43_11]|nr:MAG: hypothetical protein COT72_04290 [archaeon CG10_big_fil_rev_8_21_14_0_10_43_11]